jgi:hypothetical protein
MSRWIVGAGDEDLRFQSLIHRLINVTDGNKPKKAGVKLKLLKLTCR